jgi:hypothetical protein
LPDEPKPPDAPKPSDAPISDVTRVGIGVIGIVQIVDINQVLQVLDAATNIQNIDQYNQQRPALVKAVADLRTYLTRQDAQISSLQNQLTNAQTQLTTLQNTNNDLNNQIASLDAQIAQLKAQLASQPQKALPLHVAQSFKNVVDKIQNDARAAGGPQATITNMQIAVKALLSVQDGTAPNTKDAVLVFPDPSTPPDPNLLSTLTVNFGAIPNIKASTTAPGTSSPEVGGVSEPPSGNVGSSAPSSGAEVQSAHGSAPRKTENAPHEAQASRSEQSIAGKVIEKLRHFGSGPKESGS